MVYPRKLLRLFVPRQLFAFSNRCAAAHHRLRAGVLALSAVALHVVACATPAGEIADGGFACVTDANTGWITSLRRAGDAGSPEFLRHGQSIGPVLLRVRTGNSPWREIRDGAGEMRLTSKFQLKQDALWWEVRIENTGTEKLEIGDLALQLPMNTDYVWDHDETFRRRVFRHSFIAGNGSFLYWLPVQGTGPILVMQPQGDAGLEFFTATGMDYAFGREQFTVFAHSRASAELNPRGTWRLPRTSRVLNPGEARLIQFVLRWADSYEGVRELLFRNGGIDVHVAPGMVIPRDLTVRLALRTARTIEAVAPEFAADTTVEDIGQAGPDTHLYQIKFTRLGENLLTVRAGGEWSMPLEFFVTEPLETMVKKRAAFIVRNQQHRDPTKWYDGLYSLWDRREPEGRNLLGPDHLAGQHPYAVSGSDDPSNGKCLLVAEKNVAFPDADEVASLEYFVRQFVWGKHQRTDAEQPYPYGIYGADSWQQNRPSERDPLAQGISRPGGPSACRMWRTFDYPTYFALYFNLYRIAKQRPDLVKQLSATEYLERAYGTARAYFEVPANIRMEGGWSFTGWVYWQYTVGNFHEKYLLPLIAALEAEGRQAQADLLRAEWEKKVKYFEYDHPWPFASEMPIDSTAYESTYAAAKYALQHGLKPDTNLWRDRNLDKWFSHAVIDPRQHEAFLQRQHLANLACRGALEANYWSLGSDFRGCGSSSYTLSYMSPMGGWAVLDYALRFDVQPAANLRLGYASMLSSWALLNCGDAGSNYGFWTPGPRHDGAMSWGFQPRQTGTEWNPATHDLPRGAWPVCGEADHGLVAAIEAASTIVVDDPLFGLIALGGELSRDGDAINVTPRDGVRQRLHAVLGQRRLHVSLDRDGFMPEQAIQISPALDRLAFTLENRAPAAHVTVLTIEGLPDGEYSMTVGTGVMQFHAKDNQPANLDIPVDTERTARVQITATASPASEMKPVISKDERGRATAGEGPVAVPAADEDVRAELLKRTAADQEARNALIKWMAEHGTNGAINAEKFSPDEKAAFEKIAARMKEVDDDNTKWLEQLVDSRGWPSKSSAGQDGANAAWLLVQHADGNPKFQRRCLDLMAGLPRNEVSQSNLAYLTDRVLLAEGKSQRYGTQFEVSGGRFKPRPIEDEANVEQRRKEIGLPPMAEYAKLIEQVYSGKPMK